ncbi:unnamed protein product [Dibothriocephalus latus]|uniref:Uncharacterized protein n=1 Tax=Dibothriocephalus latus TaxID=60516 RepID=A0A3P7LJI0_DIBLA|nr:unnamed protein product [Dibothriocephalus latus]
MIGLHMASLFASSVIELEGPTWYFLCVSVLTLVLAVMIVADPVNDQLRARGTRIFLIAFILGVDRFASRSICKWIHLPFLSHWMNEHRDVVVGLLLILFVRLVLCNPGPLLQWYHARSVGTLLLVAVSQLTYRSASSESSSGNSHLFGFECVARSRRESGSLRIGVISPHHYYCLVDDSHLEEETTFSEEMAFSATSPDPLNESRYYGILRSAI